MNIHKSIWHVVAGLTKTTHAKNGENPFDGFWLLANFVAKNAFLRKLHFSEKEPIFLVFQNVDNPKLIHISDISHLYV